MLNIPVLSRYTDTIKGYPKLYLSNGKIVEEHRYIMTQYLGRELNPTEVVHHIDEDKHNNDICNLIVFKTSGDHTRFHKLPKSQRNITKLEDGSFICSLPTKLCLVCNKVFEVKRITTSSESKYCSHKCACSTRKRVTIDSKEEIEKLFKAVWGKAMILVAKDYGISDNGLRKHCKKHNIPTPSAGFWSKIATDKLEGQFCPLSFLIT